MIYLRNNKIKDTYLGDKKLSKIYLGDKLVWPQEKKFDANGHDFVEIAGIKWATMNVGASKPSDAGLYFQWGDTSGYMADQVGTGEGKKEFTWTDYKWRVNPNFTKYTTTGAMLELADDAAHANMGGSWHMPTPDQIRELLSNTTNTWTTSDDGVNGMTFTSKKNGNSIFFPAAGGAWDGSIHGSGDYGRVWSSVLSAGNVSNGQYLGFNSGSAYLYYDTRYSGFTVRGVLAEN